MIEIVIDEDSEVWNHTEEPQGRRTQRGGYSFVASECKKEFYRVI